MTATQDIRRALEQRLNTGSYTGVTNAFDIAWENVAFDPANKDRWLRPRLQITEVIPATADATATELWNGLFIVDAFTKMTATQDIRRALEQRLNTGSYTGVTNASDIAWENVAFDPANKDRWIRPRLLITEVIPATADATATELWNGLFIVDAFTKQNDGGASKADILADEIKARFPKGTQLTENGKTINIRFSQISGLIQDSPRAFKSVSMTWYAYI